MPHSRAAPGSTTTMKPGKVREAEWPITAHTSAPAASTAPWSSPATANYAPYAKFAAAQIARLDPDRDFDICLCAPARTLGAAAGLADPRAARLPHRDGRGPGGALARRAAHARRPTSASRCPPPSAATTGGSSTSTRTSSFRAATSARCSAPTSARARRRRGTRQHPVAHPDRAARRVPPLGLPSAPLLQLRRPADRRRGLRRAASARACLDVGRAHPEALILQRPEPAQLRAARATGPSSRRAGTGSTPGRRASSRRWRTRTSSTSSAAGSRGTRTRRASRCGSAAPTAPSWPRTFPRPRSGRMASRRTATRPILRKMLAKHLVAVGKTAAYLDRFPDDLTVIR